MPRVTITVPEQAAQPYRFDLSRDVVTIGRGSSNDISVGCGSVSGKHAEMHRVPGGYQLLDMDSTNGTKLDGVRQKTVVLESGMTVKLGDVEFAFSLTDEELSVLASESTSTQAGVVAEISADTDDMEDDADRLPELPPMREEKPKRKSKGDEDSDQKQSPPFAVPSLSSFSKAGSLGFGFMVFLLLVAVAAFLYGMSLRYEKTTGETLLKGIVNKEDYKKNTPAPEE
jgi:pSer/pThr/pTyr-binding forkhead associated (FHA) protein